MALRNPKAIAELGFASALWGFGFIASIWAMQSIGFLTLTFVRFMIAAAVCAIVAIAVGAKKDLLDKRQIILAFWPGMFLALTLVLQTWGLAYTTATKSGFITCLYILFVPILEAWYFKRKISPWHWFFVFTSIIGTALIVDLHTGNWNKGDALTFLCTFAASLQIFYFAIIAKEIKSSIAFNSLQSMWAFLIPGILAIAFEAIPVAPLNTLSMTGILALSLGSSSIAFLFQIRAQKIISPSTASILFLLESPFAMIFAVAFLHERLSLTQWIGVAVVLVSVGLSVRVTGHQIDEAA
jgi:drug/metabolite transporter (DMT)-like permease